MTIAAGLAFASILLLGAFRGSKLACARHHPWIEPLEDIRNTQKIRALILRGKLLDRAALDALLANEIKFADSN